MRDESQRVNAVGTAPGAGMSLAVATLLAHATIVAIDGIGHGIHSDPHGLTRYLAQLDQFLA